MATQDEAGVTFVISKDQQHLKLLELPQEVLDLLVSPNPPVLLLKSQHDITGNAIGSTVLCTHNKTFQLRQVSTSNTVYTARPGTEPSGSMLQPTLEAIAQSTSTLELHHIAESNAATLIKAALPKYGPSITRGQDPWQCDWAAMGKTKDYETTKARLFDSVPFSEAECEQAWVELICFESSISRGCFIPTGLACKITWDSMLSLAVINGVDVTGPLSTQAIESLIGEREDWPANLPRAIINSLQSRETGSNDGNDVPIERRKCLRFVGVSQLDALCYHAGKCSLVEFMKTWADAMPEKWRNGVDLAVIEGAYRTDNADQTISYIGETAEAQSAPGEPGVPDGIAVLGKRKWHEKFRQLKK